jgi:hypothetical protein
MAATKMGNSVQNGTAVLRSRSSIGSPEMSISSASSYWKIGASRKVWNSVRRGAARALYLKSTNAGSALRGTLDGAVFLLIGLHS